MTHSKFPWTTHPHTPTAVFDGDGRRIIDQWVAPDDWLPIETAPKDRFIIVYCPEDGSRWLAKWQGGEWYGIDCEHGILRAGKSLGDRSIVTGWFVSHWRDVPAPLSSPPTPTPLDPDTAAANAVMIAAIPEMLAALRGLSKMYSHAWDSVDGNLVMLGPSIERFEKAHHEAQKVLYAIDGVPMPICDDEDDAALASIGRTL